MIAAVAAGPLQLGGVHGSPQGRMPAMAAGLSERVWLVLESLRYPVHADDLTHAIWAEGREIAFTPALERDKPRKNCAIILMDYRAVGQVRKIATRSLLM
jgi:hypothetical protein